MSAPSPDLAERYGAPSPARTRLVVGVVALVAVAGLAWLVWVMLSHARPAVTSELVGYTVRGEHAATARYTVVRREADVSASCLLRAYAADHAVVGELTVDVGGDRPRAATLGSTVRTERRATTVQMVGCTAEGQSRRR